MKKIKIIGTLGTIGCVSSMIAPMSTLSSCSCSKLGTISQDKLIIKDKVVYGFDHSIDLSKYDTIEIPSGVYAIAPAAFKNNFGAAHYEFGANSNVKTIKLPHGLRIIGANAFEGCTGIETLDLTALDDDDLSFLNFDDTKSLNEGNDAFKEWKSKGAIKYNNKVDPTNKENFNKKLIANGLNKIWTDDTPAPTTSESHIVSINDWHGAAPGFGDDFFATNQLNAGAVRLAQESQEIISKYPGSTFLSCGDYNAGESFSTCKQAETLYPVAKAMNIQYSAVGNHAWEWGKTNLENKHWDSVARTNQTQGNYFVTANILDGNAYRTKSDWCVDETQFEFERDFELWNSQRILWADPYKVLDMNGHKVCIIGLTTHDTLTDGNIKATEELTFMPSQCYDAAVVYSKHLAKQELKDDYAKIESFILLTHCACQPLNKDPHTIDPTGEIAQLALNATTKIDGILAAHSHHTCAGTIQNAKFGNNVWIAQAGQSGRNYVDTKLVFDDAKPVGQRLDSISMEIKTPKIDGQDMSEPVSKRKPNKAAGAAQMKKIVDETIFPIVKNTSKVYEEQKIISKNELDVPIGRISNEGLPYYYTDHTEKSFGTEYMQSPTLIEPATVFAQRAQIYEFNKIYKDQISRGDFYPAAISFNNLDSFKNGFKLEGTASRQVTKNEVFSQNAFENETWYGCLTINQLKEYINYFLEGANKFNYDPKYVYNEPTGLHDDGLGGSVTMEFTEDEMGVVDPQDPTTQVKGTSYTSGPMQFYGLKFNAMWVEDRPDQKDPEHPFQVYQLDTVSPEIKIYDANLSQDNFTDPTQWSTIEEFAANHHGYIPIIISSFAWQGGNAQNRMLRHYFAYNEKQEASNPEVLKLIKSRKFSMLTRDAVIQYAIRLTIQGIDMDYGINEALLNSIIYKQKH